MQALGKHLIIELYECDKALLDDTITIEETMVRAAQKSGAHVLGSKFHHFNPIGVSGVVVIAESHLAIHTWPEYDFASIDIYTCGEDVDPWVAYRALVEGFKSQKPTVIEMKRGLLDIPLEEFSTYVGEKAHAK